MHQVEPGEVPDVAAAIIDRVRNPTLVALGGGRVIDTAKAIAALRGGRVCAIPTTLSGRRDDGIHRLPAGREVYARHHVRPTLVIADPFEMTTLDDRRLRASAMNALGHGAEALYVPFANPVGTLSALRGAELIASALDQPPGERDRGGLALGSILCAYALDSTGFALHHVVCQTLVRMVGTPHADTNATMLPRTMDAMRGRAPEEIASLAHALGVEPDEIRLADRVARRRPAAARRPRRQPRSRRGRVSGDARAARAREHPRSTGPGRAPPRSSRTPGRKTPAPSVRNRACG